MTDANRTRQQHCTNCGVFTSVCTSDQSLSICAQCSSSLQLKEKPPAMAMQAADGDAALAPCCSEQCTLLSNDAEAAIALLRFHFMANHRMPPTPALAPLPSPAVPPLADVAPAHAALHEGPAKSIAKAPVARAALRRQPAASASSKALHKQRCHLCRTRVGLLGFSCKCGPTFCARHRYSDTHNCTVDHRAAARAAIAAANPTVVAAKLKERI